MITTVCLNPCIDRTITIDSFNYGGMNRVKRVTVDGTGKAVNVALAGRALGCTMGCIGLLGKANGDLVRDKLIQAGVSDYFIPFEGSVRTNIKVLDAAQGVVTELNEAGMNATDAQLEEMLRLCCQWAQRSGALVLTGSLPPLCVPDYYGRVMDAVKQVAPDCALVVDAEGEKLAAALKRRPYLVKPNLYELEMLCGRKLASTKAQVRELERLISDGNAQTAILSMGADGAFIADHRGVFYAPALQVNVATTAGAGDAMLTGALVTLLEGGSAADALAEGTALAAAAVATPGSGSLDIELYQQLRLQVAVQAL